MKSNFVAPVLRELVQKPLLVCVGQDQCYFSTSSRQAAILHVKAKPGHRMWGNPNDRWMLDP